MPRNRRLDAPGIIHHVIARGIERGKIFRDKKDKEEFINRFEKNLMKTDCKCLAWSLLDNHFHVLIETGKNPLSSLMRKLLSGYAQYFNRRHKRSGYLFQNRYRSILCQEDLYFIELVRYIHLNPFRAKLVETINALDKYLWSGHSVIIGKKKREWQKTDKVLLQFSEERSTALVKYKKFVREGAVTGRRRDLTGGGLVRSAGGWKGVQELKKSKERWKGDERILGDGDFVSTILKLSEEKLDRKTSLLQDGWTLKRVVTEVCKRMEISVSDLKKKGRNNRISDSKGLLAYWCTEELGLSGMEVARYLGISRPSVSCAIERGKKIAGELSIKLIN